MQRRFDDGIATGIEHRPQRRTAARQHDRVANVDRVGGEAFGIGVIERVPQRTQNFSPWSLIPCTMTGNVIVTRNVRLRSR